ncbi:hypothetical protein [Celeribacter sp. SCSIO 80788]|uniref:hypothetical protein n=1 Tax=Celeribacter sp. SCSIO 80788 TaxID=3117013 RepID=UPI003DA486CD
MCALYAVSRIDNQTGRPHRIGATVSILFPRVPEGVADPLLHNRDLQRWRTDAHAFLPQIQF